MNRPERNFIVKALCISFGGLLGMAVEKNACEDEKAWQHKVDEERNRRANQQTERD